MMRQLLIAQRDENTCRKDFTPSEAVAAGAAVEAIESGAAKKRQAATRKRGTAEPARAGNLPQREKGRASEKVAAAVGMKRRTYEKAQAVVQAAREDPERFGPLVKEMDESGRVDRAYSRMRRAAKAAEERANATESAKDWVVTAAQDVVPCGALISPASLTFAPPGVKNNPGRKYFGICIDKARK